MPIASLRCCQPGRRPDCGSSWPDGPTRRSRRMSLMIILFGTRGSSGCWTRRPRRSVVRSDMHRELGWLLHGDQTQQDLLGLVTAAGGGLSARDLAELTGIGVYEIEETLRTVAGRSFTRLARYWQPGAEPVYVLGHEELQAAAAVALGSARLEGYRERLDHWAQNYSAQGWPAGTPEYLLRGYFRLLLDTADVPQLADCATDPARHDRMLDITGGDAVALTEITDVQDLLLRQGDYDLPVLARLNVHRSFLAARNAHVPVNLPSVWAAIGYPDRAEALARSITDPDRRAEALAGLVAAAVKDGDLDKARVLARSITGLKQWASVLADLAEATQRRVSLDRARALADRALELARSISEPGWQAEALAGVAIAVARAGDLDRAQELARSITDLARRARALAGVAEATGDLDRAQALAEQAEATAWSITDAGRQAEALADVAMAAAGAGDLGRALELSRSISSPGRQARGVGGRGDSAWRGPVTWTGRRNWPGQSATQARQAEALEGMAVSVARAGELDRAQALAEQAEAAAQSIIVLGEQGWAPSYLTAAMLGDLGQAQALARSITNADRRTRVLADLAEATAKAGDLDRALDLAQSITDPARRTRALTRVAEAAAGAGDLDRAQELAQSISDPYWQAEALAGGGSGGGP